MFRQAVQSGILSVFYSPGSQPLQLWKVHEDDTGPDTATTGADASQDGPQELISRIGMMDDEDVRLPVLEIASNRLSSTWIECPAPKSAALGIKLPLLVFIIKYVGKYLSLEIETTDDRRQKRRFRISNFQTRTQIQPEICVMPLRLDSGWNQVIVNLGDFTQHAYGTRHAETDRIIVHANCRLRAIYFTDRIIPEDSMPPEMRLYRHLDESEIDTDD